MTTLTPAQITHALTTLPGWQLDNHASELGQLVREFSFKDFVAAMRFVNKVAGLAEEAGHHPDIDIRYNKVRLTLSTHDAGGITEKDTALATAISNLR